jgi:acyl-CoA synthetase (AMP-forming)/AMP-acid ligase II
VVSPVDLYAGFAQRVAERPDATALRYRTGGGRYARLSYAEVAERGDAYTRALAHAGVRRGMRACVLVPPGPELAPLVFALVRLGAVGVFVDPGLPLPALKACLAEAAPEVFIGIPRAQAARLALGWARRTVRIPITVGRPWLGPTLDDLCAATAGLPVPEMELAPDALAGIAFTSGSTGPPKGVELRLRHLAAQVQLTREAFGLEPGLVAMSVFPPFALAGPVLGLDMVIPDADPVDPASADPAALVAEIERFGVAAMFGSPAVLDALSRHCVARGVVLGTLRTVTSAGATLDPRVAERMRRCLPERAGLHSAYGATECLPVSVIESRELLGEARRRSERGDGSCVGRPLAANLVRVIRAVDGPIATWSDELCVPAGGVGEVTVAGPSVSERYHARPAETALGKLHEEYPGGSRVVHRTGDLGWLDERGRLWFCGRLSQRVRTAAGDLYTEQVEPIANTVPGVRRTALVGVGGVPVLCVEAERGVRDRVRAELLDLLAGFPHAAGIRHVLFHPRFPVDVRHRAKIGRERLARWAAGRLR